jgi:hypothetical protein
MTKNLYWFSYKIPAFLDRFKMDRFSRNPKIPKFMKILPVGAELFHADRQT